MHDELTEAIEMPSMPEFLRRQPQETAMTQTAKPEVKQRKQREKTELPNVLVVDNEIDPIRIDDLGLIDLVEHKTRIEIELSKPNEDPVKRLRLELRAVRKAIRAKA